MSPPIPHPVVGIIYSSKGIVDGATVTLTLGTATTTTTTNSIGEYALDVANAGTWSAGDSVTVTANKSGSGSKTETLVLTENPQIQNITLTMVTSNDITVSPYPPDLSDRVPVRWCVISDYQGNVFSIENPLGVQNLDRPFTRKMVNHSSGQPNYIGEAPPGTPISSTGWRIRQLEYGDGNTSPPTGEVWANGNAEFNKVWNDYDTYSYS